MVPVLKVYAEFQQRSEPEVAAAKAVVLAAIGPQLKQRELELKQAALKKAPAVAAAKQAQRKEAVSAANRERRPVAMPNLDALIKNVLGGKP